MNRSAVSTLPEPLRSLLHGNVDYVAEHSIDPDLWRTAGREGEHPNHFLDLDSLDAPPFEGIPRDEAAYVARFGPATAQYGRLPWRVAEAYRELVEAFRAGDPARTLVAAAVLGHYAGDAHVPLHAAANYDGQLTGQTGLHARWESALFERFEAQILSDNAPPPARPLRDPVALTFEVLGESFAEVEAVLASDRASAGPLDFADTPENDRYDGAYYSKLYDREAARIRARFREAALRVGSLWLSAWIEAGRPEVERDFRFPYVRRGARAILLSLDGAAAPILDDAIARGVMPELGRLRAEGSSARGSLTSLPAKTPAGHAALFTGVWSDRNGIAGSEVPKPEGRIVESVSGYLSTLLRAEPIWVTAARQGLDVTVTSATQSYPFAPFLSERRFGGDFSRSLTLLDGFHTRKVPGAVYTAKDIPLRPAAGWRGALEAHSGGARDFHFSVEGVHFDGLVYDDPSDPVAGYDTIALALEKGAAASIVLKPAPVANDTDAFGRLAVRTKDGDIGLFFRLFRLSRDASEILLYRAEAGVLRSNRRLAEAAVFEATGGFTPNGADDLYSDGLLGPPLWRGGDGTAERRYLETVRLAARQFQRLLDFGAERTRWDLMIAYTPYPDEVLHSWFGHLDSRLAGHDAALAARLSPFVDDALRVVDAAVGHVRKRAGNGTIVAVGADHGMVGVNRVVRPNVALEKAGLLTLGTDGGIDLLRSRAIYFPGNSGYFLVNRIARPQGIVAPQDEPEVLRRLSAVLREIRDPETGTAVVTRVIDPRQWTRDPAIGGPQGGDLYFELAPGYMTSASLKGKVAESITPRGDHLLEPHLPEMWASLAIAGPGVAAGADLGLIRQIDVAPTLTTLLGIEPPAQSVGGVLCRALARDGVSSDGSPLRCAPTIEP